MLLFILFAQIGNAAFCTNVNKNALSTDDRWLAAHNYFRCLHDVPLLEWSTQVASNAQTWADNCDFEHSDSYDNTPSSGENLAQGYSSLESATEAWYDEIDDYNPNSNFNSGTGHYTAMIWESTGDLGCGICDQSSPIYVCQYANSAPNMLGQYGNNVPSTNDLQETESVCCDTVYGTSNTVDPPTMPPTRAPNASPDDDGGSSPFCRRFSFLCQSETAGSFDVLTSTFENSAVLNGFALVGVAAIVYGAKRVVEQKFRYTSVDDLEVQDV